MIKAPTEAHMHSAEAERYLTDAAITAVELSFVASLKPRIFIDGNQWCCLWGENLQDGVAGFGDSPMLAIYDFNHAMQQPLAKERT